MCEYYKRNEGIIMDINRCPHCSEFIFLSECEELTRYGRVIKQCPRCGGGVFDVRVKELSINGIQKKDCKFINSDSLSFLLLGGILTVMFALAILRLSMFGRSRVSALMFIGPLFIVKGIIDVFNDMRTYKKKKLMLERELIESKQRLENPKYAELIHKFLANQEKNNPKG